MRNRYHQRKREAFEILGGKCIDCGSTEKLEIDHKDHNQKAFSVNRMTSLSREKFLKELSKCVLRCNPCHIKKTVIVDRGQKLAGGTHGTLSSYRYCKCDLCKKAKADWWQQYRTRNSAARVPRS